VEIVPALAQRSAQTLGRLGLPNVHLRQGDGSRGWPEAAPFDRIILTAAPARLPEALLRQLADGGRLLAPVGDVEDPQLLVRVTRQGERLFSESLLPVRFVPMTGGPSDPGPPAA
jgi:protein-L-isoaspartate(D-aspartate) O-methyltransferase